MDIQHKFRINTTSLRLYEAITTPQGIHRWWAKDADVKEQVGEVSVMRFAKEAGTVEMHFRIDELTPGRKVVWTCVKNPNPAWLGTVISFRIENVNNQVELTFIHGNWDAKWNGQLPYEQTKEGWQHFMKSIREYCETGIGQPW